MRIDNKNLCNIHIQFWLDDLEVFKKRILLIEKKYFRKDASTSQNLEVSLVATMLAKAILPALVPDQIGKIKTISDWSRRKHSLDKLIISYFYF